jgi:hypothetical protein
MSSDQPRPDNIALRLLADAILWNGKIEHCPILHTLKVIESCSLTS